MASYDVIFYGSEELRDHCRNEYGDAARAQKRAALYLEESGNRLSNHSITTSVGDGDIPAPVEPYHVDDAFSWYHCDFGWLDYHWLQKWFRHYHTCEWFETGDVTMLLTYAGFSTSGGVMDTDTGFSVAQTGYYIAQLPDSYQKRGTSNDIDGVDTVLHEFAHFAMGGVADSHQRADEYIWDFERSYPTVMNNALDDGDENHCGQVYQPSDPDAMELYWDDCCRQEWS